MIKAVLFDMDGTLLPMNMEVFVDAYMRGMCRKMAPYGYEPKKFSHAIWKVTEAMLRNDGSTTNETVFWNHFFRELGEESRTHISIMNDFHMQEFQEIQNVCGFDPRAAQTVRAIRDMGFRVILATNPVFPACAVHSRIRWAGLTPEDFEYITTYENSCYSKPNPAYYREILEKLKLNPEECVMVGNDALEDMVAATLGIRTFLMTEYLVNTQKADINQWPNGSFPELMNYIQEL